MKEKIFFKNSKGNGLCAILSNPTSGKESPIVVLCHGFSTSKDGRTYVNLERILSKKSISTFRFDFFGHGESEGQFEDITVSEAVDDVLSAVLFLKQSGYSRIGLIGSSFGGMASIIAAPKTDDLYILALKSPLSDYMSKPLTQEDKNKLKTWKEKGFVEVSDSDGQSRRLNYSFFEDASKTNGYTYAQKIKIPTLIVHGDRDETIPVEQSIKSANLIKNCRLEIIDGADHTYSNTKDFQRMLDLISQFIIDESKKYVIEAQLKIEVI